MEIMSKRACMEYAAYQGIDELYKKGLLDGMNALMDDIEAGKDFIYDLAYMEEVRVFHEVLKEKIQRSREEWYLI